MNSNFPTVGFDRFVELAWADYALKTAITRGNSAELKSWLEDRIQGKESARKTANMLTNLWLKTFSETAHLREEAFSLASETPNSMYIVLHWGMAFANFPLFQHAVTYIGRLLRLQGSFNSTELSRRVSENYSNQGTIPRLLGRILQSLVQWKVLLTSNDNLYTAAPVQPIEDIPLLGWLFQASIISDREHHIALTDLLRLPGLFPFDVSSRGREAILTSPRLTVLREGMNQEYVVLSPSNTYHEH